MARACYSGLATHVEFTMPIAAPGEAAPRAILADLKQP